MNRFLVIFIFILVLLVSLPFIMPASLVVERVIKNANLTNISYSYIEGNFFNGRVYDLTYNDNLVGDFNYDSHLSLQNLEIRFVSVDQNNYSGRFIKEFSNYNFSDFSLNDIKSSNEFNMDNLGALVIDLDVKKATFKNNSCTSIEGSLILKIKRLRNQFSGDLFCRDGNKYGVNLLDNSNRRIGSIQLYESKIKGSLSTEVLSDRRLALFTDELSFTIDL